MSESTVNSEHINVMSRSNIMPSCLPSSGHQVYLTIIVRCVAWLGTCHQTSVPHLFSRTVSQINLLTVHCILCVDKGTSQQNHSKAVDFKSFLKLYLNKAEILKNLKHINQVFPRRHNNLSKHDTIFFITDVFLSAFLFFSQIQMGNQ